MQSTLLVYTAAYNVQKPLTDAILSSRERQKDETTEKGKKALLAFLPLESDRAMSLDCELVDALESLLKTKVR